MSSFLDELGSIGGRLIDSWGWLDKTASNLLINHLVNSTRNRPHPWSTASDYTSWKGLTDRNYLARQLPARDLGALPPVNAVTALFARPNNAQRPSAKSTCLFPAFAQYLTDGFLRTVAEDRRLTTSNHEIDLCQLYGRNEAQTDALRVKNPPVGEKGRLKSQMINGEEYSPFLYENGSIKPEFDILDRPLGTFSKARSTTSHSTVPPDPVTPVDGDPTITSAGALITSVKREFLMDSKQPLAPQNHASLFAIGGDRANSTPFTAMMNTLFLREHNRVAGELERRNPGWDDERVFQTARNIMIPMFIKIVVEQYINHITPVPFGLVVDPSLAWDAKWNRPNWMTAEFSLLYRWHSLVPDTIDWAGQDIPLAKFGLNNDPLINLGLGASFQAAASQPAAELGTFNTGAALMIVEHLAIQQGRDNHLASYNDYREAYGMSRAQSFADISSNDAVVALLGQLYSDVDQVEFYPGLFAEDLVSKSPLPQLLMVMVGVDAFSQALTNPLLSEHVFNAATFTAWGLELIMTTNSLGDVLERVGALEDGSGIVMTQPTWRYGYGDHNP